MMSGNHRGKQDRRLGIPPAQIHSTGSRVVHMLGRTAQSFLECGVCLADVMNQTGQGTVISSTER
jgi:hypothetical protein